MDTRAESIEAMEREDLRKAEVEALSRDLDYQDWLDELERRER